MDLVSFIPLHAVVGNTDACADDREEPKPIAERVPFSLGLG
jgi:hypothetical protein